MQIYCVAGIGCALLQRGDDRAAARPLGTLVLVGFLAWGVLKYGLDGED